MIRVMILVIKLSNKSAFDKNNFRQTVLIKIHGMS